MRLLSATVRNYRLHHETTVSFDPHLTLIGGLNESGKSTFAEALHRALFLKSKGNTGDHRGMISSLHQGHPEVVLTFAAQGITWQLTKRFGSSGTTTLAPGGRPTLTGDAAETELARVLGVEAGLSGKAVQSQWSHLWVWQHQSADDPTSHANSQKDHLLQRLQTLGGAAAMQSAQDGRIAAAIASARDEILTIQGKPKAHSGLAKAEAAAEAAILAETAAAARAAGQEAAVAASLQAGAELDQLARDLGSLQIQKAEAIRQQSRILQFQQEEIGQRHADTTAASQLQVLEKNEASLAGLRQQLASLEAELAPLNAATTALANDASTAQSAVTAATRAFEQASDASVRARQQQDLAQAWSACHQTAADLEGLRARAARVAAHQAALEKLRIDMAGLPAVDAARLSSLEKLFAAAQAANAAFTAMATGIEVIAAGGPVLLSGELLATGGTRILTEETDLQLGDLWHLRIRPGGGTSLEEARRNQRQATDRFRAALEQTGVRSLEEAAATAARLTDLQSSQRSEEAALTSLQAGSLPQVLAEAQEAHTAAAAGMARRAGAFPDLRPPSTPEAARLALTECSDRLAASETAAARAKAQRDATLHQATVRGEALQAHQESLTGRQTRRTGLRAQLDYFLETHGSDTARAAALAAARQLSAAAAAALAATRQTLSGLQPEQNEHTLQRLQRSLEDATRRQTAAETRLAVAESELRSDGSIDPVADLALARARAESAREHLERLRRHAGAIQLLHQTFTAEQQALADRFTGPLADRISGYLECLFGPGTRAVVQYEKQEFAGLHLYRPQRAMGSQGFDTLSGGTREQTAAAVRLAMAEVLASDHEGTLPILFDDAFTHSDPVRLQQLQNMLDLAARRGLQVILLTCSPADYAALGAVTVGFQVERGGPTPGRSGGA